MTSFRPLVAAALVFASCALPGDAHACGEVMFRAGGALRYHAFMTRHPAAILLVAPPSADQARLHDQLEKAGHHVLVVRGPAALERTFAARRFDVLIVDVDDLDAVRQVAPPDTRPPLLIPVSEAPDGLHAVHARVPGEMRKDADVNDFLKVIEHAMTPAGT